jgi:clan AA aspartic protease
VSTFTVPISVSGAEAGESESLEAWVDTGSLYSWIPEDVLARIGVQPHGTRNFTLADGKDIDREVGRVWVTIDDRTEVTIVVFGPPSSQVLLGAYALEGLSLAADPINERLIPMTRIQAYGTQTPEPRRRTRWT